MQSRSLAKGAISKLVLAIVVIILVAGAAATGYFLTMRSSSGVPLVIYSADAYVPEVAALASGFTSQTGIQTSPPKGGGSFALAQQIAQGNPVSVFVSVAKSAVSSSYLKNVSSGWAIAFAGDQMTIAYSNASAQSPEAEKLISAYQTAVATNATSAWFEFFSNLSSGSVKVGISNPSADPAGFRGWLVLEAAGKLYAGNESYFVSRMLGSSGNTTGASAAELVAPLESGQIQFLFIYKSSAVAHKLNYFQLPTAVNFGNASYSKFYSQFTYALPSGVESGSPILLFVTVPSDATNPSGSLEFVSYIVQHSSTLQSFGLTPLNPSVLYNETSVPEAIQRLVTQGDLVLGGSL